MSRANARVYPAADVSATGAAAASTSSAIVHAINVTNASRLPISPLRPRFLLPRRSTGDLDGEGKLDLDLLLAAAELSRTGVKRF